MNHCCCYSGDPWKVKALCVIIMSRKHFRMNIHPAVPWISRNAFLETGKDIWCLREYRTDKYSQYSIIRQVWQNGWVFVYKPSDWVWIPLLSHIVSCLNVFAKLQDTRGASRQPVLIGIVLLIYICWPYQSTEWFVISPLQVVCRGDEILWLRERCLFRRKLTQITCR